MHLIIKLAHSIVRLFPPQFLVHLIYQILILIGYRKQVINNNYKSTIGLEQSNQAFRTFYKECLMNIARIMVETISLNKKQSSKVKYSNLSKLETACKDNNGIILMASHYGNWELACINLPLHTKIPCYGVYKPLKNKNIDKKLIELRSQFGLNLVPMNSIARSIAGNHTKGVPAIYILIADQNPRSIQSVVWIEFLGLVSAFSNGLVKFHKKYNLPFAYMKTTPGKAIYEYQIDFEFPTSEASKNEIQWYSQQIEDQIKEAPQFWLWSHKRWKRKYKEL